MANMQRLTGDLYVDKYGNPVAANDPKVHMQVGKKGTVVDMDLYDVDARARHRAEQIRAARNLPDQVDPYDAERIAEAETTLLGLDSKLVAKYLANSFHHEEKEEPVKAAVQVSEPEKEKDTKEVSVLAEEPLKEEAKKLESVSSSVEEKDIAGPPERKDLTKSEKKSYSDTK